MPFRTKVDRTADLLGVADVLQKYPRQTSGGQRQRVAAARRHRRRPEAGFG